MLGAFAAHAGIKLLEAWLSIHKGCFMSDSFFVMKLDKDHDKTS